MTGLIAIFAFSLLVPISCDQGKPLTGMAENDLPNIILIMADDLGYGDVACYGNPIGFLSPLASPLLKQETRLEEQYALIDEQYKLISVDNGVSFQLYDLITDEGECTDISLEQADVFTDMKQRLLAWISSCRNDNILMAQ